MNKFKSYKINKIPITELPSSDQLSIWVHHFVAKKPGKKIYLQANLHGPEVMGIGILLKLIDLIKEKGFQNGEVKIVVSANPIALNSKISGYQVGYKNLNSTKYVNWNRIFKPKLDKEFYKYGLQIEDKLALTLQKISKGFDIAMDFHSAQNNTEAIYTFASSIDLAKKLGVAHIVILEERFSGCFDEAFYFANNKNTQALTLELYGGFFDEKYLNTWANYIYSWLHDKGKQSEKVYLWKHKYDLKYYSSIGGLIVAVKNPGDFFKKGEKLAEIWGIDGKKQSIKALTGGVVFRIPLTQIIGSGEEVIEVFEKGEI